MAGCRDCGPCTRPGIMKLFYLFPRIIYKVLLKWNVGLFFRHCPTCGDWMSQHHKRADGSFQD